MHMKTADHRTENTDDVPAHQERAYEFVACPVKSGASQMKDDIDPSNMVTCLFHMFSLVFFLLKSYT